MIVIAADTHKKTHTLVAVLAATGELIAEITVPAKEAGYRRLAEWARGLEGERVFRSRTVATSPARWSASFSPVASASSASPPSTWPAPAARSASAASPTRSTPWRSPGRRCGGDRDLPAAWLDAEAREIKLSLDHREDLVAERTRIQNRLRWHLHDLWPELELPGGARPLQLARPRRRQARSRRADGARSRLPRAGSPDQGADPPRLRARARAPSLDRSQDPAAPRAARLRRAHRGEADLRDRRRRALRDRREVRPPRRVAPIPASSGNKDRHRLDRGGNRQLNCALHRIAVAQGRTHAPARDYLTRKQSEGKSRRESLRCLKRQLARSVLRLLRVPAQENLPPSIMRKMEIPNLSDRRVAVGLT